MELIQQSETPDLLGPDAHDKLLKPNEVLFWEGETPQALHQVLDGFGKLTWTTPTGRETICELLMPGDIFDLPSCLDGHPYPFSCKALSNLPTHLSVISRAALLSDPELGSRCQARMVVQMRQQRNHRLATAERVEVRVSRALLWLAFSAAEELGSSITVPFSMTRQEIADWVGTTTETVIRVCSHLRKQGLVVFEKGSMTLVHVAALRKLAC